MAEIVKKYKETFTGIDTLSRYKNLYRLEDSEGNSYLETQSQIKIPEKSTDTYYKVDTSCENRLDLVSYKFYNTPLLWWVIAYANDIDNPFLLEAGIVLRIPSLSSLYSDGGALT